MKLILFRHGLALDREDAIQKKIEDSQRPLITKGKQKTEKVGKTLKEVYPGVDSIVSSPFLRAKQTAKVLSDIYGIKTIHECPELVPSAPPQSFAQWMKSYAQKSTCMIAVGHEPQLHVFASWALAGTTISFIEIKKSGFVVLEFESLTEVSPRSAQLQALIQPKNLA